MAALPGWEEIEATLAPESSRAAAGAGGGDGGPDRGVAQRYRALFSARQHAPSPAALLSLLRRCLDGERSILMRHECAYVMGQQGNADAIPVLRALLHSAEEDEVTRHEAAEAMAAICDVDAEATGGGALRDGVLADITRYADGEAGGLLRDTCVLAREGLVRAGEDGALPACSFLTTEKQATERGVEYTSKDPARGIRGKMEADVPSLTGSLLDEAALLYPRYEAMFSLRDVGGDAAVGALCDVLSRDASSVCLRHEAAFVLGQMEHPDSAPALITCLQNAAEHTVVRHEAAVALGAVGTDAAEAALRGAAEDPCPLVAESCVAALASLRYWREWEELERRVREQRRNPATAAGGGALDAGARLWCRPACAHAVACTTTRRIA